MVLISLVGFFDVKNRHSYTLWSMKITLCCNKKSPMNKYHYFLHSSTFST